MKTMQPQSSALRFWGIVLGVTVGLAAFGLAATDPAPSRWVGAIGLIVIVVVGAGQPVRLLGVALALVLAGLYVAAFGALSATASTPTFAIGVLALALAVALSAEMFGRVCTAEDERRLSTAAAVDSLTPTDPLAGVLKWQHAVPLFERELARAKRLGQDLSFLLVRIEEADDLDRRLGPDGAAQAIGAVGSRLQRLCRATDVVLYRGVGQFGVVLPDTSPELASVVARRIVEAPAGELSVALLVGAASYPRDGEEPSDLIRVAAEEPRQLDTERLPPRAEPRSAAESTAEIVQ